MRPITIALLLLLTSAVRADSSVISAINDNLSSTVWTDNFKISVAFTDTSYEIQETSVTPSPFVINRKNDLIFSTFTRLKKQKEVVIKDITGDGLPDIRITNMLDKNGEVLSSSTEKIVITYEK
ncbi:MULTISPECIES: hypothetical protein [unclassified Pseudoalteromonas]|uniref:hypothetical protein n=1 Tax=unclassified Pseudoalteromonas TaxID=194690 RepID=UPI000B3CEDBF|nr:MULTISPECIES: hypothetical protein [unclassified Pseudoalteromonas]MDN3377086.1 hypothetical protein [Pseudoalteromonas sp. APC 3893]MDN3385746.1 hypothetical protein [Pseudoalteromonas sp. APC 4017]OUS73241.1 hypothetical protein B5G52_05945 [Pseudoalteromonas sp. A601]